MKRRLTLVLVMLALASAFGQVSLNVLARETLSRRASISLLTMWPGREIYIAFGHSALRVRDPAMDLDLTFNYGTFDFGDPLFVPRFVGGRLRYYLDAYPFQQQYEYDKANEHRVWVEQTLNLDQGQMNALFHFLVDNARPENKYYRYDFIADNCSTRIRDALAAALGDSILFSDGPELDPRMSFRRMIDQYVAARPIWRFAFFIVLGRAADRGVTPREAMFLPQYLLAAFDKATITHDGQAEPLVLSKERIIDPLEAYDYGSRWMDPAFLLWPIMLLALGCALYRRLKKPEVPWAVRRRILDFAFFLLVGLVGIIIVFLDYLSVHTATKGNLNILWLLPTHAVAALLILRPSKRKFLSWYFLVSALIALVILLAWPVWPQDRYPTMIPAIALVAIRSLAVFDRLRKRPKQGNLRAESSPSGE